MILTAKQEQGLKIAVERYKNREKYTVISGYAGTGKTTLVRFIIEALGVEEDEVCYACFTGKACQVLLKKGNKNVSTLHRLLYDSIPRTEGGFYRKPKHEIDYSIIVVDEVSMVPKDLINLLFSHRAYIICLGDPFQLPPIDKDSDNHLLDNPHVFLDEIMRQAAESEIIWLSQKIRKGEPFENFQGNEVQIFNQDEVNTGMMFWANQILVGTNQMRVSINNQMRQLLGRGEKPEDGDKIICLRNYWDSYISNTKNPLVNGTIGYLDNSFPSFVKLPFYIDQGKYGYIDVTMGNFKIDDDEYYSSLTMDQNLILTGTKTLDWKTEYKLNRSPKTSPLVPLEFTYGYAITCHKAQGSQWDKVLVMEEGFPYNKEEHARWLYTAVTRSAEKLVLVR